VLCFSKIALDGRIKIHIAGGKLITIILTDISDMETYM